MFIELLYQKGVVIRYTQQSRTKVLGMPLLCKEQDFWCLCAKSLLFYVLEEYNDRKHIYFYSIRNWHFADR